MTSLSADQIQNIIITERVSSIFSLVGATFVVVTFLLDDKFRKPINRLVFYATFGNVVTNIATLISTSGIEAGPGSSLCQFQAFLIQWFMPADALWTFAMSCNVYLSFFRSYDTSALKRLEWKYLLACYGIPLVPALVYLFASSSGRGKIYGSATLWCWVSIKWDFLRVATFYGPVWVVILTTIGIYIKVGSVIFKWRKHLLSIERDRSAEGTNEYPAAGIMKTSEVIVTRTEPVLNGGRVDHAMSKKASFSSPYPRPTHTRASRPSGGVDPNKAALKYCKCAMLFFVALIITWVPSTINRIYTIIKPQESIFGLNLAAALVLPLQGFWNAMIYTATSTFAVKCLCQEVNASCQRLTRILTKQGRQQPTQDSNEIEVQAFKLSSSDLPYDTERACSQSELVGQAK